MKADHDLGAIVTALARYLYVNPLASDSLEGIRHWWFNQECPWPEAWIEEAVSWMKERKLVEELNGSDGRVRYRRIGSDAEFRSLGQISGDVNE
jgi:hypothetical protein